MSINVLTMVNPPVPYAGACVLFGVIAGGMIFGRNNQQGRKVRVDI